MIITYGNKKYSIEDAFKARLSNCNSDGAIERLKELIDKQNSLLSALMQKLYENSDLDDEFIKEQLHYSFNFKEE